MRAVHALILLRGGPPGIHQEHLVGRSQVQALASGFQPNQHHLNAVIRAELRDILFPLLGSEPTVIQPVADTLPIQSDGDDLQHGDPLGENHTLRSVRSHGPVPGQGLVLGGWALLPQHFCVLFGMPPQVFQQAVDLRTAPPAPSDVDLLQVHRGQLLDSVVPIELAADGALEVLPGGVLPLCVVAVILPILLLPFLAGASVVALRILVRCTVGAPVPVVVHPRLLAVGGAGGTGLALPARLHLSAPCDG
mmetsp:Transcript_108137/g.186657  ORF Transcript_108137/g.186657 Transcript_108137/m.186657 type:complete len:250 (+) Transcript_108137:424-1173(+)